MALTFSEVAMSCEDIEYTLCGVCLEEAMDKLNKIKTSEDSMMEGASRYRLKRTLLAFLFDACYVDEIHQANLNCLSDWIDEWIDGHFSPS
mgnify:FL=1